MTKSVSGDEILRHVGSFGDQLVADCGVESECPHVEETLRDSYGPALVFFWSLNSVLCGFNPVFAKSKRWKPALILCIGEQSYWPETDSSKLFAGALRHAGTSGAWAGRGDSVSASPHQRR